MRSRPRLSPAEKARCASSIFSITGRLAKLRHYASRPARRLPLKVRSSLDIFAMMRVKARRRWRCRLQRKGVMMAARAARLPHFCLLADEESFR